MEISFITMFAQATFMAKLVLVVLLLMSIASWGTIIFKFYTLTAANKKTKVGIKKFTDANNLREAVQSLGSDRTSPLYYIAQHGVAEFNRLREAGNSGVVVSENVSRALQQGVSESLTVLNASLSYLATAANTAPFIGLFGTVWGIMFSFHRIGMEKVASLATVAPGISEALIATAVGLFVAIPATIGYNLFLNKVLVIESDLNNFASVFLNRVQRELNARAKKDPQHEEQQ